jgi:hypothetical protein
LTVAANAPDLDRAHPERVIHALLLIPLLVSLTIGISLAFGMGGSDLFQLVLALFTAAIALIPLVADQGRRPSERHVLLSTFTFVFIIGFVLPVFVIFMPAVGPIDAPTYSGSSLMPEDVIRGQLATILGLVCLLIGYALPVGRMIAGTLPTFRHDWPPAAALAVASMIIPFGWIILLSGLLGIRINELGSGFVSILGSSYIYGIALLTIVYLRHKSSLALVMLAVVIPLTSLFGLFTGSKQAVLIAGAMVVFSIILVRRRIGMRWIALSVLAASLTFPIGQFVRQDVLAGNTLSPVTALRNPVATVGRISDFVTGSRPGEYFTDGLLYVVARMDCIGAASVLIRDTPRVAPFQNGRTLALFFVAFVPRLLWPEKPTIPIGEYITEAYVSGPGSNTATAPTQLGEYFINFGYPGIVGGMLLFGVMLRFAHHMLLSGRPTTPALLVAVVVLFRLVVGFQGATASNFAVTVMSIPPIVATHVAVRMLFPTPKRPLAGLSSDGRSAPA